MSISLSNETILAGKAFGSGTASARYELASNGDINKYVNGTKTKIGTWDSDGTGDEGNFEVEATVTSGTLSGGLSGQWLSLDANPAWEEDNGSVHGTKTVVFGLVIRDKATHTQQASATITLEAALFG